MKINSEKLKDYAIRITIYLIWTCFVGLITVWYWFISRGNILVAYGWNIAGISAAILIGEWSVKRVYKKLELCPTDEARKKMINKDVTSFKTSLYLFYIFALIFSHMLSMDIGGFFDVSDNVRAYFDVVGNGLILLFAIDTFLKYLVDDDKRVKRFKNECMKSVKNPAD